MGYPKEMQTAGPNTNIYKRYQAINKDFRNTNYDKGHLSPMFYQCDEGRNATFTMTNAVPQDPCFNQNIWKNMEEISKDIMRTSCSFAGAKRFFVTGAVPTDKRIPIKIIDEEGDETREYKRVSLPLIIWTAACCDSSAASDPAYRNKGFSFSYYGKNEPDSWPRPGSISSLQSSLASYYPELDIFIDSCFETSQNSKDAIKRLRIPLNRKVSDRTLDLSKSSESSVTPQKRHTLQVINKALGGPNSKIVKRNWRFSDADIGIQSLRTDEFVIRKQLENHALSMVQILPKTELASVQGNAPTEEIKGEHWSSSNERKTSSPATILSKRIPYDKNILRFPRKNQNLQERVVKSRDSNTGAARIHDADETYAVVLDQFKSGTSDQGSSDISTYDTSIPDHHVVVPLSSVTRSAMGDQCRYGHSCGKHGYSYYWCYTDWSDNYEYCCENECDFHGKSYQWCKSGTESPYCSPPYSRITISGKPCRADHECGLHGNKDGYFWCYTDQNDNYERCCQPWHNCLSRGETYNWCYTGYEINTKWQYCYF